MKQVGVFFDGENSGKVQGFQGVPCMGDVIYPGNSKAYKVERVEWVLFMQASGEVYEPQINVVECEYPGGDN